jgi:hypothetical protein
MTITRIMHERLVLRAGTDAVYSQTRLSRQPPASCRARCCAASPVAGDLPGQAGRAGGHDACGRARW